MVADINEHVVYDFLMDGEMMDLFRPSLEEAFVIESVRQDTPLDFIGMRGSAKDVTKDDRIE